MKQLNESILDLLRDSAVAAVANKNAEFSEAASKVLSAMESDGLLGSNETWVYYTVMNGMIESGALRVDRSA